MLMAMWLAQSESDAQPLARIDLTPMIGVLAALVVLFALSVPTLSETPFFLGCHQRPLDGWFEPLPRDFDVQVTANGTMYVDGLATSADQFDRVVAASGQISRQPYFHLRVGAQAHYDRVAEVLETFARHRVRLYGFEQ